ncbi:putative membrane protein [Escherichia coli DEC10B]|nr:putative membrane protein [Escherichia coli DEC10B]GCH12360.1 hypothetical protein BvCms28BK_05395 [Escherichia coli]STI08754.1 Uncharacterised protein [Escherichia coli]
MRLHVKLKEFLSMFFMAILFSLHSMLLCFLPELNLYIQ